MRVTADQLIMSGFDESDEGRQLKLWRDIYRLPDDAYLWLCQEEPKVKEESLMQEVLAEQKNLVLFSAIKTYSTEEGQDQLDDECTLGVVKGGLKATIIHELTLQQEWSDSWSKFIELVHLEFLHLQGHNGFIFFGNFLKWKNRSEEERSRSLHVLGDSLLNRGMVYAEYRRLKPRYLSVTPSILTKKCEWENQVFLWVCDVVNELRDYLKSARDLSKFLDENKSRIIKVFCKNKKLKIDNVGDDSDVQSWLSDLRKYLGELRLNFVEKLVEKRKAFDARYESLSHTFQFEPVTSLVSLLACARISRRSFARQQKDYMFRCVLFNPPRLITVKKVIIEDSDGKTAANSFPDFCYLPDLRRVYPLQVNEPFANRDTILDIVVAGTPYSKISSGVDKGLRKASGTLTELVPQFGGYGDVYNVLDRNLHFPTEYANQILFSYLRLFCNFQSTCPQIANVDISEEQHALAMRILFPFFFTAIVLEGMRNPACFITHTLVFDTLRHNVGIIDFSTKLPLAPERRTDAGKRLHAGYFPSFQVTSSPPKGTKPEEDLKKDEESVLQEHLGNHEDETSLSLRAKVEHFLFFGKATTFSGNILAPNTPL